jgi:hypothetical protein
MSGGVGEILLCGILAMVFVCEAWEMQQNLHHTALRCCL